jgi:parallel beta-helix repeat protein
MKSSLPLLSLILAGAAFGPPRMAQAQTPTLEFAAGANNPTTNGPTVTSQVITFQNNANNPSGNTFATYTPTTTVTFALSNQAYTQPTSQLSTGTGMAFGARSSSGGAAVTPGLLFDNVGTIGGSVNANYTSVNGVSGGIDVTTNKAVELFTSAQPLPATVPANARYSYADLTVTFSQPTVNPVLHITGLGGAYGTVGFTAELDLISSGVTLSKLSGSNEFNVTANQILNSAANPGGTTGSGGASGSVLVSTPNTGVTSVVFRVFIRPSTNGGVLHPTDGSQHVGESWMMSASALTGAPPITGYVYEDVNYGGGAGRPRTAAGTVVRPNARVELYNSAGTFVSATTTDANGMYSFAPGAGNYTVRVVNSTVTSSRTGAIAGLLPVQTYNGGTTSVGGQAPEKADAGSGAAGSTLASLTSATTTAESIASVSTTAGATTAIGADFGYNFDTVVNTNTSGQGSLSQFITNANALGGEGTLAQSGSNTAGVLPSGVETSIFMIPSGAAVPGQVAGLASSLTNGVAVIQATAAGTGLPTITGPLTIIDGTTQTFNIGNTNNVTLGVGGTVGTANTPLGQLNGPEVQLLGSTNVAIGVNVAASATNTTIKGLAVLDFGNAQDNGGNGNIVSAANNLLITQNVLGTTATSFTKPATLTNADNIHLTGTATGVVVSNNLIGFSNSKGIAIDAGVVGTSVIGNEVRSNGQASPNYDGVDIQGRNASITNNLFTGTSGQGIDSYHSAGGNTITGNTVTDNGRGTANLTPNETPGVRIYGAGNSLTQNIISNNYGSGILLEGAIGTTVPAVSNTLISQNSIFGNGNVRSLNNLNPSGAIGIDLEVNGDGEPSGTSPYVTTNSTTTTGANGLLNYPVITSAYVLGSNLVVTGYAKPNAAIELFLAQANPTTYNNTGAYFGQGKTYLTTLTEGGTSDTNISTNQSYSGIQPNGVNQGSDTQANGFSFSIPLSSLPAGALTGGTLPVNTLLTATATLNNATSEFSGNVRLQQPPVPNDVTNVSVADNQTTPVVLNPNLSATAFGQTTNLTATTANTIASGVVSPITTGGTLYYNGTAVTTPTTVLAANIGQLTFVPTRGFIGNATFTYTALDANNLASSTHKAADGTISSGPATYTIPVTSASDVTVAITGPTTLSAGQPTGTYTATFTNEGPYSASNVARVITLPSGASVTGITNAGATVGTDANGNTTLTYAPVASLTTNASSVVTFAFTAPTTVSAALTLAANTTTTSSEGANTAPNQATLTLSTVTTADVRVTSITPSATATTGKFDVVFGNNGPQTAAGVVYTVQLPAGLGASNVVATNGGTYNNTTGLVSYTATNTLTSGSTFTSAITYPLAAAPSVPVTATARVSTTTDEAGLTANNAKSATMSTQFDLTTTLTGPATAIVGSPTMLYVTTTNNGPNTAATAAQTVTIPSATTLAGSIYITNGGTYSFSNGTGTVTFPALTNLPSGQTVTNSISFLAPSANFAPIATVTTSTTETNTTNNTANFNVAVSTSATPANEATTIAATVGTTTTPATVVSPGSVVTYTVTSTNKGYTNTKPSATAIEKVQLLPGLTTTTLKVGGTTGTVQADGTIQFSTPAATGTGTLTTTYAPTTGVLTYYSVTQASGVTEVYPTLAVTVPAGIGNAGQLVATASVSTDLQDNVPADNVASVGVLVKTTPDVATTITGPSSTVAGLPATYAVKFTNNGATDAINITETAQLPAGLSSVVVTDDNGSVVNGAYNPTTGQVTFPSSTSIVAGASQAYTLTLTAPGQSFPLVSTIASATNDGVSTNNSASLSTTVTPNADLAVSISGPTTAVVGNSITYVVTTTNNGPTTATGVVPTLQLPTGLTVQSNGGSTVTTTNGIDTYTFPNNSPLPPGGSIVKYISFTMPSPASGQITGAASVSSTSIDAIASNNTAALTTSTSPATTENADLVTSITLNSPTPSGSPLSIPGGSAVNYTANYRNGSTTTAAANVVSTASLPTGLLASDLKVGGVTGTLAGNVITFNSGTANGATYNTTSGLLTFPTIASMAPSAAPSYDISFTAPGSGPLVLLSEITSSTSDNGLSNNRGGVSTAVSTVYDVTTTLAGPLTAQAGATNTYTVTTLNAGPSVASAINQNVTGLPAGLTTNNLQVDGLTGTVSGSSIVFNNSAGTTVATYTSGTLTFPTIASQPAGAANELVHSFSFPMNAVGGGSVALAANVTSAGENANSLPNTSNLTTKQDNIAPVAQNVWNTLQSARANDANLAAPYGLLISPLNGSDADGVIGQFTLVTVPSLDQGKLYYNGGSTALVAGSPITDGSKLYFAPAAGYVGNATFTYLATDNGNGVTPNTLASPVAIYTIPVAQDQAAPAYTLTPTKGGSKGAYVAGDVVAYTIDPNVANYGATGIVYSTDGKTLNTNANNGITNAITTGTLISSSRPGVTSLSDLGLAVDATGRLFVSDPGTIASPKLRSGNYSVSITTIDANGGVTTQTVAFVVPSSPLPVVLTAFTATAVQNRDALLSWTTASEINSAYFDVERSFDGSTFTKVSQVAAKGNTTSATNYSLTDASVAGRATGAVYYRLKQVDFDGTASYSPVRSVSFTKVVSLALSLYPNPAVASTTLDLSQLPTAGTYQVLVLDATGRQVRQLSVGGGLLQPLDLTQLASGTYHVLVTGTLADGSALRQTLRLTKE